MRPDPVSSGAFAEALFMPDMPPPAGLTGREGNSPARRFAVYRNNVTVSLIDAMASIFPTVQNLVGEDFFRAMARLYVTAHPPTSPLLFTYGERFPAFLENFPPAAELPFLSDVARVERLWLDAFHAADAAPLDPSALSSVPVEDLAGVRFQPHPATRIARLSHAAGTITRYDRSGISLEGLNPMAAESVLVTRPAFDVRIEILPKAGAGFFEALLAGETLGNACLAAGEEDGDIPTLLSLTLTSGAFTAIDLHQESDRS
ncbi:putative DNA-binding domain-containing protein [Rhizobium sp. AQ_MP]|uniref:HvfC/BufC N-terminal domain-containing protein n=1 Tax=Rhizobium sp. AQ_MP TaxID=2761536 RepID=UPI00163A8E85|nr:DNA-binding domain-containing protein [Rhizobium sp. AQ_MP]MBC2772253.1 putative DNA-binding domain-containing protein [Rhizobium sp. AQ_MP]